MNGEIATEAGYPQLAAARADFQRFLGDMPKTGNVVVLADGDVDGLGAAVTVVAAMVREGVRSDRIHVTNVPKGANAFTPEVQVRLAALKPAVLFVLDLGIRDVVLAPGVPTLFVDHHRPAGVPPDSVAIGGYGWTPTPTSSLLAFLLCGDESTAWKAGLGNAGDLGPEFEPLTIAMKAQKMKWIKEATSLLNAAKRSSDPEKAIPAAYTLFRDATSAQEIMESTSPEAELLRGFQAEVKSELAESRRVAPKFSKTEPIAILRFDSPARVHPLLAQSWRGRLPKFVVMAVNAGYIPGRVQFSLRTNADINLLDLLAKHGTALATAEPEYGLGHDKATGGSLTDDNFARLMASMGF